MPEQPILVFPEPHPADRAKRPFPRNTLQLPQAQMQAQRLQPQFLQLQEAMERRRFELRDNVLGIQPEQVLVLETIGSINNFVSAIRRISGFEWLGEFGRAEISPTFGFEDNKNPEKPLNGQLFLVMTNQQALAQMQSLFARWQQDEYFKFPHGLTKLRDAFEHLETIRSWGVEDRIRETGVMEDWQFRLEEDESEVPFEVELWFRSNLTRRQQSEAYVRQLVGSLGGSILQQCVISEINYHALLGMLPRSRIQEMVQNPDILSSIALLQCDDIMHLRPVGQCAIEIPDGLDDQPASVQGGTSNEIPLKPPIVALLDGMPLTGHQMIARRLIVDDPDAYETAYLAQERVHGTAMSSLICLGDMNDAGQPISRQIYVRPITKPRRDFNGRIYELIPSDVLPLDLVHRSVMRMFEGEGGESPAAPSVRVVNLSICDPARPLNHEMSSWARLLDWLSWKYNILFIVSAGNQYGNVYLGISRPTLSSLTPEEFQAEVVRFISQDTRNRRILSPSETMNGITIGAVHSDSSSTIPSHLWDPFINQQLPSIINSHGPGYRQSIKPDVLLPGGRQLLAERLSHNGSDSVFEIPLAYGSPGQLVAAPGPQGELHYTRYMRGTSNATALASRAAHFLYDVIEQLREDSTLSLSQDYDAVVLKTLLVHGASWSGAYAAYDSALRSLYPGRVPRAYIGRFLGYGQANTDHAVVCTDQRVTALGVGALRDGDGDEFSFPLPPSLSSIAERRVLTITLTWLTPISSSRQSYRVAHLWFNPTERNILARTRLEADHNATQRGTVQHEVLKGDNAVPFQDGDSIVVRINCRSDAGEIVQPIRYCLAVTLEVPEASGLPIYEEVRDRLSIRIPVPGLASP